MTGAGGKTVHRQIVCLGDETTFGNVANVNSSGQLEVAVGNTVTVTATDLDVRDLSSASDSVAVTDGGGSVTVDNSNLDAALSTRASEATLALIKAKTDNLDVALSDLTTPADTQPVSIASTVTVDTELPAAAALSDSDANPTTPTIGVANMIWSSASSVWERFRRVVHNTSGTGLPGVAIMGNLDDTSPVAVTEGNYSPIRMSSRREIYTCIRDAAGNERGVNVTAGNALTVDNSAVTQPVSAASLPLPSGASTSAKQDTLQTATDAIKTAVEVIDNAIAGAEIQADIVAALPAGDNAIGRVKLTDGTDVATVRDLTNSDPLDVSIVDGNGDQITSFGGGTQYTEGDTDTTVTGTAVMWEDTSDTMRVASAAKPLPVNVVAGSAAGTEYTEDAASAANPAGGQLMARRRDALAGETTTDGDVVALNATDKGELYVKHVDAIPVTDNGGALTVDGTVAVTGVATEAKQDTQITSLQLIDDTVHATNGALGKTVAIGGQLDDAVITDATENNVAPIRITTKRAAHVNLRNDGGTEIGTAGAPIRIDPTGTTTQPVSAASLPLPAGASTLAEQQTQTTALQLIDNVVYTEADTDATITGIPILWEDAADTLRAVSAAKPLPVDGSGVTQPVSGTVAATQSGSWSANVTGGITDDTGFTPGASGILPVGFLFDDVAPDSVNEGDAGICRMSANRNQYIQIRDAAGNERGANVNASNELTVSAAVASTPKSSTSSAPAQGLISTTSGQAVASNSSRKRLMIQNTGTTILKVNLGATAVTQTAYHVALQACSAADDGTGGAYIDEMWTGAVQIISSAAGGTYVLTELS